MIERTVFCRDCNQDLPKGMFYPYRINGDRGRCKPCDHLRTAARRKQNPELVKLYLKRSIAKDPDHTRAQARKYYYAHQEARRKKARERYHLKVK